MNRGQENRPPVPARAFMEGYLMNGEISKVVIERHLFETLAEIGGPLGLNKTRIKKERNITSYYVIGINALEIEVDWHENVLFLYVVRLLNGKLPNNGIVYKYDDGSWCRKYVDDIYKIKNPLYQSPNRTKPAFLLELLLYYKNLIKSSPNVLQPYLVDKGTDDWDRGTVFLSPPQNQ